MTAATNVVRVGTRGSKLARTQTNQVLDALRLLHPAITFEAVVIRTTGDERQGPFAAVGTKGMFVKEIEEALLSGVVDFAVHSMKDMPGELPAGLELAVVPRREDPRDALVSHGLTLADLPRGARVGTSSLRRRILVQAARPDVDVQELRGNLDTRVRKLDEGQYDAIVLACAGMERLGVAARITERLPADASIPAPGQGALALETRAGDEDTRALLLPLNDPATAIAVAAERAFQAALGAGCSVPAGAHATVAVEGDTVRLVAFLAHEDGTNLRRADLRAPIADAAALGRLAATELRDGIL